MTTFEKKLKKSAIEDCIIFYKENEADCIIVINDVRLVGSLHFNLSRSFWVEDEDTTFAIDIPFELIYRLSVWNIITNEEIRFI